MGLQNEKQFYTAEAIPSIIPSIKKALFNHTKEDSQKLLKLIKYSEQSPYAQPNLTFAQMNDMLNPNSTSRRIFDLRYNGDMPIDSNGNLIQMNRFFITISRITSSNTTYSDIVVQFAFISHVNLSSIYIDGNGAYPNHKRILEAHRVCSQLLNGADVGGRKFLKFQSYEEITFADKPYTGGIWNMVLVSD